MTKSDKIIITILALQCACFIVGFAYIGFLVRKQRR